MPRTDLRLTFDWLWRLLLSGLALLILTPAPAGAGAFNPDVQFLGNTQSADAQAAIQRFRATTAVASLDANNDGVVQIGVVRITGKDASYTKLEVWSRGDRDPRSPGLWVFFDDSSGQNRFVEVPLAPAGLRRVWDDWRMQATYERPSLDRASWNTPFAVFDPRRPTDIQSLADQEAAWRAKSPRERTTAALTELARPLLAISANDIAALIQTGGVEAAQAQGYVRLLKDANAEPSFFLMTDGPYALSAAAQEALSEGWRLLVAADPALVETFNRQYRVFAVANGAGVLFSAYDQRATASILISDLGVIYFNERNLFQPVAATDLTPADEALVRLLSEARQADNQRYWGTVEGDENWRLLRADAYHTSIETDASRWVQDRLQRWYINRKITLAQRDLLTRVTRLFYPE